MRIGDKDHEDHGYGDLDHENQGHGDQRSRTRVVRIKAVTSGPMKILPGVRQEDIKHWLYGTSQEATEAAIPVTKVSMVTDASKLTSTVATYAIMISIT